MLESGHFPKSMKEQGISTCLECPCHNRLDDCCQLMKGVMCSAEGVIPLDCPLRPENAGSINLTFTESEEPKLIGEYKIRTANKIHAAINAIYGCLTNEQQTEVVRIFEKISEENSGEVGRAKKDLKKKKKKTRKKKK